MDGNKLETLPESIGNLKSLERLNLYGNQLLELPESIINLTSLKILELKKNPLVENLDSKVEVILKKLGNNGVEISI